MEHSADQLDRANDIAQSHTDEAVDAVRRAAAPEQDPDCCDPDCCDCGEEIEAARLKLLRKRCVSCQSRFERRQSMYAGRTSGGTWGDRY